MTITADGISIVGESPSGVIIMPNTPANNLLLINNPVQITTITFESTSQLATGITLTGGNLSVFDNVRFYNFLIGISCMGGTNNSYGFNTCLFVANGTAIAIDNTYVECNNCTIFGSPVARGLRKSIELATTASLTESVPLTDSSTADKLLTHKLAKQLVTVRFAITASFADKLAIVEFCTISSVTDKLVIDEFCTISSVADKLAIVEFCTISSLTDNVPLTVPSTIDTSDMAKFCTTRSVTDKFVIVEF